MKIGAIGTGHMSGAIIDSALASGLFDACDLTVFDIRPESTERFVAAGALAAPSVRVLLENSNLIILGVRPLDLPTAFPEGVSLSGKCVVSILAGVPRARVMQYARDAYVVRVMPSATQALGFGAAAVASAPDVPEHFFSAALSLFSCGGIVEVMDEDKLCAVIGVNGSSPAYFYKIADIMARTAAGQGIEYDAALRLIAKIMQGSAKMIEQSGKTPGELVSQVATPGGTTIAAITAMEERGIETVIREGMLACTKRAVELSK